MIKILILFILLIVSIIIGPNIAGHQGYVLIQTNNYNIETSITSLIICFIILQFIFYFFSWCYYHSRSKMSFIYKKLKWRKYNKVQ